MAGRKPRERSRVGEKLRALIPEGRGEQSSLAYRAKVRPEALNKILTGKTSQPEFDTVAKIAAEIPISLDALWNDEPVPDRAAPYRDLIDNLENLSDVDRMKFGALLMNLMAALARSDETHRPSVNKPSSMESNTEERPGNEFIGGMLDGVPQHGGQADGDDRHPARGSSAAAPEKRRKDR